MKLYLLKERDDNTIPTDIGDYDTFDGFVIRAKNETSARKIARNKEYDRNAAKDWENPAITECIPLSSKGQEEIILESFRSG